VVVAGFEVEKEETKYKCLTLTSPLSPQLPHPLSHKHNPTTVSSLLFSVCDSEKAQSE
jgi:hypothetical protein